VTSVTAEGYPAQIALSRHHGGSLVGPGEGRLALQRFPPAFLRASHYNARFAPDELQTRMGVITEVANGVGFPDGCL